MIYNFVNDIKTIKKKIIIIIIIKIGLIINNIKYIIIKKKKKKIIIIIIIKIGLVLIHIQYIIIIKKKSFWIVSPFFPLCKTILDKMSLLQICMCVVCILFICDKNHTRTDVY